jgi:5'-deoxynucleotidase YfbR-like HD superfamily hydrolase
MRWHTHPEMAHSLDSIGGHQGRVAAMLAAAFPDDKDAIIAAVLHDIGEAYVADVPSRVKKASPELREILHKMEAEAIAALGIQFPKLTELQAKRVYFFDQLDALMWAYTKTPWLSYRQDWQEFEDYIAKLAAELGVDYELPTSDYI